MKPHQTLAIAATLLCGACSTWHFDPTENWVRDGGRLCAATRDAPPHGLDRAAPRSCAQAEADVVEVADAGAVVEAEETFTGAW